MSSSLFLFQGNFEGLGLGLGLDLRHLESDRDLRMCFHVTTTVYMNIPSWMVFFRIKSSRHNDNVVSDDISAAEDLNRVEITAISNIFF